MLEAWYIPCKGSNKLVISNHPMTFNKGGYPGSQPGFDMFGPIEVNLIPDYVHLNKAGYNVLVYDMRNHGRSQNNWGGPRVFTTGYEESKDMVGALQYAKARPETKNMDIALYARCMAANSTIVAFHRYPEFFKDIKCLVALQPVSAKTFVITGAKAQGMDGVEAAKLFDQGVYEEHGLRASQLEPQFACPSVHVPTLIAQVRKDVFVDAELDTQEIYDLIGCKEKKLFWIEGTTRRFDGYNYFPDKPEELIGWLQKYMPAK